MLEKNSSIALTEKDIEEFNAGNVSERVSSLWGLSYEELKEIITTKAFTAL